MLLGLIPEPPFDPRSWSGSSAYFFRALQTHGVISRAYEVSTGTARTALGKARTISLPIQRWKARYHASVPRFSALTDVAKKIIALEPDIDGVLQIGALFSSGITTSVPCFGYHDANAALLYRYYGRGLLSEKMRQRHLDWERSVYSALTGIFVMSEWLADSFHRDFDVPRSKLHVVGAGINIAKMPEVPERLWSAPRFLFVGKDFERKGGQFLLRAFKIVREIFSEAELIIVGPTLQIEQPGVVGAGYLSKSDPAGAIRLHQLFASATTVVLPSIYEPFGISLLEGMAYGLPCIAANRCAMPEIVRHEETGLIVRAEDSASLASAMIEFARSPRDAATLGINGRKRVESDFTWNAVAEKVKSTLLDAYGIL